MLVKIYVDFENKKVWSVNKISDAENVMEYVRETTKEAVELKGFTSKEIEINNNFVDNHIKLLSRNYLDEECIAFVDDVELNDVVKIWVNFSEKWVSYIPTMEAEAVGTFKIALREEYI